MGYSKRLRYYIRMFFLTGINVILDVCSILVEYKEVQKYARTIDREKMVGFIADRFMSRIEKIAYGLTANGYNIILICNNSKNFSGGYSAVFTYRSSLKALWLAQQFTPVVYHVFSNWKYDVSYKIIRHKHRLGPIVFDDYDVMAGMVYEKYANNRYPGHVKKEKYCLENADGLCCRSLETQYAKREMHYRYQGKRIFFPEYLWKKRTNNVNIEKKKNAIIYVGGFNSMVKSVALELEKIGWSLDIYPAHLTKRNIDDFPKNVTVFKSISPQELALALQKYPVAIQFPGNVITENALRYTPQKFYYSAAGKIFDYLEAGIKVLISDSIHQKWLLTRYGAAIDIDVNNPMEDIVKKLSVFESTQTTSEKQTNIDHLTITNQTKRLLSFYHSLSRM